MVRGQKAAAVSGCRHLHRRCCCCAGCCSCSCSCAAAAPVHALVPSAAPAAAGDAAAVVAAGAAAAVVAATDALSTCQWECADHPRRLPTLASACRTISADVKVCANMRAAKGGVAQRSRTMAATNATTSLSLEDFCNSGSQVKVAFVTPFPPRPDGLADYAANLRAALLSQCANLQVRLPAAAPTPAVELVLSALLGIPIPSALQPT